MVNIDEPVVLSEYDPEWPARFEREKQAILQSVPNGFRAIEHFGSTAVPGLLGKPTIDILIGADVIPPGHAEIRALEGLAYDYLGEAGVPGRFYFRKRRSGSFNIALVLWNGPLWKDNLILRDFLRSHPEHAARYAGVKEEGISAGKTRLLDYSAHKQTFLTELLVQARALHA